MKKVLAITLIALFVGAVPRPADAQVGVSVVFDPANYKSAVLRYLQLLALFHHSGNQYCNHTDD